MRYVFCDNHLLVVDKPSGLLTQPSGTDQASAESLAKQWIKEKYQKPGNVFLEAIHRLDKPASGLVLFARTSKALSRLQEMMRNKFSRKTYWAIVEGTLKNSGVLEHYLLHDDYQARVVDASVKEAKSARLKYHVLNSEERLSLVEIELETGRYHQIRAQFSEIGHPIVGDAKYGSKVNFITGEIALNHHKMQITHPINGEICTFISAIPATWQQFTSFPLLEEQAE